MKKESFLALIVALSVPVLFVVFLRTSFDTPEVLNDPAEAYRLWYKNEFAKAEETCRQQLKLVPGDPILLSIAARAAAALREKDRVQDYFRALPEPLDDPDPDVVDGFSVAAESLLEQGHVELAEELLRFAIDLAPWDFDSHRRLARLLRATGRRREAHDHFVKSMRGEPAELVDLLTACSPDIRIHQIDDLTQRGATTDEDSSAVQLGLGMIAYRDKRWEEAETHFRRATAGGPAAAHAHAMVGWLLAQQDRWDELTAWYESLPEESLNKPEVWYIEGRWAEHRGETREAVRCLAEAVRHDPMNLEANEHLAAALRSLDQHELAEPFQKQRESLTELRACVAQLPVPQPEVESTEQPDAELLKQIVTVLDALGREWEAGAWAQYADTLDPPIDWAFPEVERIAANLTTDSPAIIPAKKPIRGFQLADFPLPQWSRPR